MHSYLIHKLNSGSIYEYVTREEQLPFCENILQIVMLIRTWILKLRNIHSTFLNGFYNRLTIYHYVTHLGPQHLEEVNIHCRDAIYAPHKDGFLVISAGLKLGPYY